MPSTIRLELFPHHLPTSIDFYTTILSFTLVRHEPDPVPASNTTSESEIECTTGYAHLRRDTIQLGLSTKPSSEYPSQARDPSARPQFRKWPVGVEIVMEVDDVWLEKERIVGLGWTLESEMGKQEWGLWDFRVVDPDGYFWRISERGGEDGMGKEEK